MSDSDVVLALKETLLDTCRAEFVSAEKFCLEIARAVNVNAISPAMQPVVSAAAVNADATSALALMGVAPALHSFLDGSGAVGGVSVVSDALSWAALQNTISPGSVVIDPTGVEDSAAGLEAWIAAGYALDVRRFYLPNGRYKVTSPVLLRDQMALVGDGFVNTQIRAEYCGAIASYDPETLLTLCLVTDLGIYGKDGEEFLADGVTPNSLDNYGLHFKNSSRCQAVRLWDQGFTNGIVIDGTETTTGVYSAILTYIIDCYSGYVDRPHGNNNFPQRNRWFKSDTLNGGPDGCGIVRGTGYLEINVQKQLFDGDGATTLFTMTPLKVGKKLTKPDGLIVYVDNVLQELTTDYTVSGINSNTPSVTFVSAPPGTAPENVNLTWSDYVGIANIDFDQANGCFAQGVGIGGSSAGYRFNERGCSVVGGYLQIAKNAFEFTANSSGNEVHLQGVGISESGVRRIVQDGGKGNKFLPNVIGDSLQTAGDFTTTASSVFASSISFLLKANAIADDTWIYRAEADIELSLDSGSPSELGCDIGLQRFNPKTAAYEDCHSFPQIIRNPGTGTAQKRIAVSVVDKAPFDKLFARNPFYRLSIKALSGSQATLKSGAALTLSEEHYHAIA